MIEGIAQRLLQRVRATQPPVGYYREQLVAKLQRLSERDPLPPEVARKQLCGRLPDLARIRERLTRQTVTVAQIEKLKGIL